MLSDEELLLTTIQLAIKEMYESNTEVGKQIFHLTLVRHLKLIAVLIDLRDVMQTFCYYIK